MAAAGRNTETGDGKDGGARQKVKHGGAGEFDEHGAGKEVEHEGRRHVDEKQGLGEEIEHDGVRHAARGALAWLGALSAT